MHHSDEDCQPAPQQTARRRWSAAAQTLIKINVVVSIAAAFFEAAFDPLAWFALAQFWISMFALAIMQPRNADDVVERDGGNVKFRRVM